MEALSRSKDVLSKYESKITKVEEYLKAVDDAYETLWGNSDALVNMQYNKKLWYRGVRSQNYQLVPSICRGHWNVSYETIFMSKFKSRALPYLGRIGTFPGSGGNEAYWYWLFLMQHYGVPTRLLDWSEDALIALLFAIDIDASDEEKKQDAAVYCLNPVKLNMAFNFHNFYPEGYVPNVEENGIYEMFGPERNPFQNKKPCAVFGPMNNPRIIAQRGTFTVFPYDLDMMPLDEMSDKSEYLYKIVIDKTCRYEITQQLRRYGMTKNLLMAELESIAAEITEEGM